MPKQDTDTRYPPQYLGVLAYICTWAAIGITVKATSQGDFTPNGSTLVVFLMSVLFGVLFSLLYWSSGFKNAPGNLKQKYLVLLLLQVVCAVTFFFSPFLYLLLSCALFVIFLYFATSAAVEVVFKGNE